MGWLLDHPDVHVTEVSDAETVSDEYSDEEVLEELEEAEPPFPAVSVQLPPKLFSIFHMKALFFVKAVCAYFFGDISLQGQW